MEWIKIDESTVPKGRILLVCGPGWDIPDWYYWGRNPRHGITGWNHYYEADHWISGMDDFPTHYLEIQEIPDFMKNTYLDAERDYDPKVSMTEYDSAHLIEEATRLENERGRHWWNR